MLRRQQQQPAHPLNHPKSSSKKNSSSLKHLEYILHEGRAATPVYRTAGTPKSHNNNHNYNNFANPVKQGSHYHHQPQLQHSPSGLLKKQSAKQHNQVKRPKSTQLKKSSMAGHNSASQEIQALNHDDMQEYRKLQTKLQTLQGKILAIRKTMEQKKKLKKTQSDKKLTVFSNSSQKKTDLSKFVTQVQGIAKNNQLRRDPYLQTSGKYYVSQVVRAFEGAGLSLVRQHILQSLQTIKFMKNIRKPTVGDLEPKKVFLPKKQIYKGKKTVILDLDETLIHCNESTDLPYDKLIEVEFATGECVEAGVNIRPHAIQLIKKLSQKCEVIVFTASHPCYANVVIDLLDPGRKYIMHRLFREHCWQTEENIYVKDLRILGDRDLKDVVLVDNAAYSYFFQMDNGIPVFPYYEGSNDYELKHLITYIQGLLEAQDVRQANREYFKLHRYAQFEDCRSLVSHLYSNNNN